jgi:hypothetical protein
MTSEACLPQAGVKAQKREKFNVLKLALRFKMFI